MSAPRVASLRRYPVKAMTGEPLDTVEVDARGLAGDRVAPFQEDIRDPPGTGEGG